MKKRGQTLTLQVVIEMLVAAIVIAAFLTVGGVYGSQEIYYQARAARDAALVVDVLYDLPDNAWMTLPYNVSGFSFQFFESYLKIFGKEKQEATAVPYSYVKGEGTDSLTRPEEIYLSKNGGNFLAAEEKPSLTKLDCEKGDEKLNEQLIQIDVSETVTEPAVFDSMLTRMEAEIGERTTLGCRGCTVFGPVSGETILIKLKKGDENRARAYFDYNSAESRNLGCMVLNRFLDEYPGTKINLVPSRELDRENWIVLETGKEEFLRLGLILAEGLEGYYE